MLDCTLATGCGWLHSTCRAGLTVRDTSMQTCDYEPPPLHRDYKMDPYIKALDKGGGY